MTDNENIFISQTSQAVFRQRNIAHLTAPVQHSTTNGQVERIHSTILEIANALAKQNSTETVEEVFNAITQYNNTIHSVTKFKPNHVFFNCGNVDLSKVRESIERNQQKTLDYHNKNRVHKTFKPGDVVFLKSDRRRKDKKSYTKHTVQEDQKNTVLTTTGKIIHKDNLRNTVLQQ